MPTLPPPSPLQAALRDSRRRVLLLLLGTYLLFAVVTALIDPPGAFPQAYRTPKFWGAGVMLLALLGALLAPRDVPRVATAAGALLVPLLWLDAGRVVAAGTSPLPVLLWSVGAASVAPLLLGSRQGGIAVAVGSVGLALVLAWRPPTSPDLLAGWVTGGLVTVLVAGMSYISTRFIEANLVLHEQANAQLHAARFDALTRVLGRAATEEELMERVRQATESRAALSVVMCDIDHFKSVNDVHGHAVGDVVLRDVAKRLRRTARELGGLVGRWGGEEFLILLPGLAKPEALALAERVRQAVGAQPVAGLSVTASFGVASLRALHDTEAALLARADQAMYEAKRAGRDSVREK
ncbi:GGDEF domain-containing protein [Deinococcus sp. YIM 134068]|uniref:GGDEF domain-containing protein n=1 Tax=Deinococcus lichenicola TaxID=3118910 RepID=UPI002F93672F